MFQWIGAEKSFLTFPGYAETIGVKRKQGASFMLLQQRLIRNQNKTALILILTLSFESHVVFMAQ